MTIVVYHPIKGPLTSDETKVAADRMPGEDQRAQPGHYFACGDCGFVSKIFTGEDSRLRAIAAAHMHHREKEAQRVREFALGNPTSDPAYHNGVVEPDDFLEGL